MSVKFSISSTAYDFFRNKIPYVVLYLFLSFSYPLGSILVPHYYGKLIEKIVDKKSGENIKNTFITTLGAWVLSVCGINGMTRIDTRIIPEFRSYLYEKIAEFVFETYKENYATVKSGELISKLSKLPYLILEMFYQVRTSYLPLIYMVIFSVIYFFSINVKLGALVFSFVFLAGLTAYWSWKTCVNCCVNSEDDSDKTNEDLQDILENILNVYTTNNIQKELEEFTKKNRESQKNFRKCLKCSAKFKFLFSAIYILAFCIIAIYIYKLYQTDHIKLAQINSAFIVLIYLLSQMDSTLQYFQETITYIGSIIDIQNYINNLNTMAETFNDKIAVHKSDLYTDPVDHIQGKIEFKNIDVCFEDNCILKNFSAVIDSGTKVALTGRVGVGKSSLLKMILKLTYPTSGKVLVDDKNLPYDVVRNYVSYIPQSPMLFNRSLYQNIVYGTDKTRDDVLSLMQRYGLQNIFGNTGLDDNVGKGGSILSGGQKQMVILLRAVLRNTPIILLDEPTTALDSEARDSIINLIFDVFRDKTVIMITHDNTVISKFQQVLQL